METLSFLILLLLFGVIGSFADSGELWCVAKNNAEDSALQAAIDWACGPGGADCRPIQQGGPCFEPSDIQSHASYAFNDYFVRNGFAASACDFSGTAALTSLNPGQGSCVFPSSSSARNGSFAGTSAGSTVGFSPVGADLSGSPPLQLNTRTWPLNMALMVFFSVLCSQPTNSL
ncbi:PLASMODESMATA CALLOSE-BINDING PROTEIN 5-like [Typha latifolia]|uniref:PLASMODESMATA CALLOSE-BINDING PROTEIN 5-like n=1 Tax=Typha latifolia TaxID=4733 RepID=UPI003C2D412D